MATIIAGRFDTQEAANEGVLALTRAGFAAADTQTFYVSPPGMHGNVPIVDNEHPPVGTEHAEKKAAVAAVAGGVAGLAAGIAAAPLAAPAAAAAGAIAGAGVGAYGGALIGGVTGSGGEEGGAKAQRLERAERRSGIMVAVNAEAVGADRAIEVLRGAGAEDIERATGDWRGGWADFNASALPEFVDRA